MSEMNNGRAIIYAAVAGLLLLTHGCSLKPETYEKPANAAVESGQGDENARKLLESFIRNNAKEFVAVLPGELQKQFGVKEFADARANLAETLGKPISYQFDTILEHPLLYISVWKVRFERRGSEGEMIRQEVLFRVISGSVDGQSQVVSFNFL